LLILLVLKRFGQHHQQLKESLNFPVECSQAGLAARLGVSPMAVSKSIRRLLDGNFVSVLRGRVTGGRYKKNVYILTNRGADETLRVERLATGMEFQVRQPDGTIIRERGGDVVKSTGSCIADVVLARINSKYGIISYGALASASVSGRRHVHGPVPMVNFFAGRKREMQELSGAVRGTMACALEGLPGIGKTSLAAAVVPSLTDEYDIFWFGVQPSSTLGEIQEEVAAFSTYAGCRVSGASALQASGLAFMVSERLGNIPTVFIFDDAHNASENVLLFIESLLWYCRNTRIRVLLLCRMLPKRLVPYVRRKIVLGGVDVRTASEITGLPDNKARAVSAWTAGHPLLLQKIRGETAPKFFSSHDVRNYIYREFYSGLSDGEREQLKFLSVVRKPVLIPPTPETETLVTRNIVTRDSKGGIHAHEVIREYVSGLLSSGEKKAIHRKACVHYRGSRKPDRIVELVYHMTEAGRFDDAAGTVLKHWEKCMMRGYGEELARLIGRLPSCSPELLLAQARLLNETAKWDDAYIILRKMADSGFRGAFRTEFLNELSGVCISMSRFTEGRLWAKDALSLARGETRIGPLYSLFKISMLKEEEKPAIRYLDEMTRACRMHHASSHMANALVARGFLEYTHNNFKGSIHHWKRAYKYYKKTRNSKGMSTVYNNISSSLAYMGEYNDAIKFLKKAASAHENLGNPVDLARTQINIAKCHLRLGRPDTARSCAIKAGKVFEKVRVNRSLVAVLQETLGEIESAAGNLSSAASHFSRGEKLTLGSGDESGAVANILGLSHIDFIKGRFESAKRQAGEALRLAKRVGDAQEIAHSMMHLGQCTGSTGGTAGYKKAMNILREASRDFRQINDFHGYQSSQCAIAALP
jgi:tetratricopeptide (TPR) repeat protein